jgi:diaminopimelate epimerase
MSGAGNDFVVIDNRAKVVPEPASELAAKVCARQAAVGADGMLLLEASARKAFRMRYFNADGSEAEMCGNGARCIARFAHLSGAAGKEMEFENMAGDFKAQLGSGSSVRLEMTLPHTMLLDRKVAVDGREYAVHSLNTGVPHALVEWPGLAQAPVFELGRKLRRHEAFAPKGTNVNFAEVLGPRKIALRTYERGVEDETLACGTGAVASAILMTRLGKVSAPVEVAVKGKDILTIHFDLNGDVATHVVLEGPAVVLYEGKLNLEAFGYHD